MDIERFQCNLQTKISWTTILKPIEYLSHFFSATQKCQRLKTTAKQLMFSAEAAAMKYKEINGALLLLDAHTSPSQDGKSISH